MLELATLGLLLQEPLHGYRLKQQLELFMSSCICVNYGAIYPLLRRLQEREEIVITTDPQETEPTRKTYSITAKGRKRWHEKMLEHPKESWVNGRSRFMIKLFFFSYLQPNERVKLLEHRLQVCRLRLEYLEVEGTPPCDPYASTVWQRSLKVLQGEIEWLCEQLTTEQKELYQRELSSG